jgi:hypothetical protein
VSHRAFFFVLFDALRTTRFEELGGTSQPQTDLLMLLRNEALARVSGGPRNDPASTHLLFEREFERTPRE